MKAKSTVGWKRLKQSLQCGKRALLVNFEGNTVEVVSKVKLCRKNR